ncbi:unnamed protein product [Bursaphelenchus okinawaensis]|uniref:Pyridoxine-5'-phosphate oxidase n=1 Tax=Bursaphelenchus okinawaensis TaxID=465554 RepID=A0A811LHK6_9BILA|nr:unnamed protein product [Bursaphelenchus okinawaensis]CAG9123429.1 unnamed protein product [Bursaphelenchus okinawaensis]
MDTPHQFEPVDVSGVRKQYLNAAEPYFLEQNCSTDPFHQFHVWFSNVLQQSNITYEEMNAVCLSTCVNNKPSSRMVLMKSYNDTGFTFYTNSCSRKGQEIAANNNGAMMFYWPFVNRQVRIEGTITEVAPEEATKYWDSRPTHSKVGGSISNQSQVVESRQVLEDRRRALDERVKAESEQILVKPQSWTGYTLKPNYFEFWQGQSDRIHDRLRFKLQENQWIRERIQP